MIQAFLVALVSTLASTDFSLSSQNFSRPMIIGPLVGLVMGDLTTGIIIGGTLELIWMGVTAIGAVVPPNIVIGSALATVFTIKTGTSYEAALAIAVPAAMLGQLADTVVYAFISIFAHKADEYAEKENYKGIERCQWLGLTIQSLPTFIITFIGCLISSDVLQNLVNSLPEFIEAGLAQSGSLLPAVGIAMLIKTSLDKKFVVFLFIGFVLVAFFNASTMAVAAVGVILAIIYYQFLSGKDNSITTIEEVESEEL